MDASRSRKAAQIAALINTRFRMDQAQPRARRYATTGCKQHPAAGKTLIASMRTLSDLAAIALSGQPEPVP
jgi:hypothetical protein